MFKKIFNNVKNVKLDKVLLTLVAFFNFCATTQLNSWSDMEQRWFLVLNAISVAFYMLYYALYKFSKEISDFKDTVTRPMGGYFLLNCKTFIFSVIYRLITGASMNETLLKNFYMVFLGSIEVCLVSVITGAIILCIYLIKAFVLIAEYIKKKRFEKKRFKKKLQS